MAKKIGVITPKDIEISTGFIDIDYQLGGLKQGDIYLIGASFEIEKLAFVFNIILHMTIEDGQKVALFSIESKKEQLLERLFEMESLQSEYNRYTGKIKENEQSKGKQLLSRNLVINDICGLGIEDLDNELEAEAMSDVKVVFIDDLQLLEPNYGRDFKGIDSYYSCEHLKEIAQKHNVAVVVLSQLHKAMKKDDIHRMADSVFYDGDKLNYFDNISFIYCNNENEGNRIVEFIIARDKYCGKGVVYLSWFPKYQRFDNVEMLGRVDGYDCF